VLEPSLFGGQKPLHSQSCVRGRTVVMEHLLVHAPFVWPLPRHVPPKPPQDAAEKLRIDCLT
jgi:hypothetical protein